MRKTDENFSSALQKSQNSKLNDMQQHANPHRG
jgi:hypothetical protein